MCSRVSHVILSVLLAVSLVAGPVLLGCGEEKGEKTTDIVVGMLADFTGPAASGCTMLHDGMADYFRVTQEEDPIPGARLKVITYDNRLDYGRNPVGYQWMKGQGAKLMVVIRNTDFEMLVDRFVQDQIPCFGSMGSLAYPKHEWIYMFPPITQWLAQCVVQWIWEDWDGAQPPVIGHVGIAGYAASTYTEEALENLHDSYPDRFERVEGQMAPSGTATWSLEIDRVKNCDFIIPTLVGPSLASFIKQIKDSGCQGRVAGTQEGLLGFYRAVLEAVSADYLDGVLGLSYHPLWIDDIPSIQQWKEAVLEYHAKDAQQRLLETGSIGGWAEGMIIADAIRRAVDEVGAEDVDGTAIRDALATVNLSPEGWGNAWSVTPDYNIYARTCRMHEFSKDVGDWVAVSDWYAPLVLGD